MIELPRYKIFCANQPLLKALEPPEQEVDLKIISMTVASGGAASNDLRCAPVCKSRPRTCMRWLSRRLAHAHTLFGSSSDACFSDFTVSKMVITLHHSELLRFERSYVPAFVPSSPLHTLSCYHGPVCGTAPQAMHVPVLILSCSTQTIVHASIETVAHICDALASSLTFCPSSAV